MTRVRMIGGPRDGETIETPPGVRTIKVAVPTNPAPRRPVDLSWHEVDYDVYGTEARWEGMITDAYAVYQVTNQALSDRSANRGVRAMLREIMTKNLQRLAPEKVLDRRKIWRAEYDRSTDMVTLTAFVGPRRVRNGLAKRDVRRGLK